MKIAIYLVFIATLTFSIHGLAAAPQQIADKAVASVKKKTKWERIEITKAEKSMYSLVIWYKAMPSSYSEVENDTKAVARAVLKELVADGAKPAKDWISVYVRGYKAEKGETGSKVVRAFGKASYNFNNDQIEFERAM